ncbi:hypothetical protein JB92DRAFT_3101779 [Gautieria morchelliformis]|nr:hypothetical protein JB92DRAFT_3101779 [Gautieria morchelliformis]
MAAAMGLAANIIAVLRLTAATISACYNYGSSVKNASRDKTRIIDQLFGLQKVLETLNELLLHYRDELQSLNAALERGLGRKGRMQALIWPLKENEVHKTLDKLGKLQNLLTTAMDIDHTHLTLKINSGVKSLQERTAEISQAMEQAKSQEHRQEIQKIYKWLAAPDHWSKHRNARNLRQAMTGSWFIEGNHFQEWRESPHSFLWLHGIPGAGKTILCSTIIKELSCHCHSDPFLAMAFFYFDFNNKDTPPDAMLQSLIVQLFAQCVSTTHALESLFSKKGHGGVPGQEDLMSTLKTIISGFHAVYIVFDALDECAERSRFLTVIREIHGWEFGLLHLLTTSWKEQEIEEVLNGLISQEFRMYSAAEKEMVMTTLIAGAHGIMARFRWVVCQLDALQKCRTPAALKKALGCLPKTLSETYDRILAAIDEDNKQGALSLLQWLAFSFGTLSIHQAVDLIATDPDAMDEPLFDLSRQLRDPRDKTTAIRAILTTVAAGFSPLKQERSDWPTFPCENI